ncbi:MAG TPA: hypothetical protein DET40_21600 [Lentisphaeria bacterium]|nr:MAG: hypothetical protein A2X45_03510 [Lentisphaerae bacterium GWF2_50_93]HCE46148.1 hypothetical protein [Lentisphaeria bacterium]
MATFESKCPLCGKGFQAEDEWIGQTGECPECGKDIKIQGAEKAPEPAEPRIEAPSEISAAAKHEASTPDEKPCPFCGEMIKSVAIKCKHCQSMLNEVKEIISSKTNVNQEAQPGIASADASTEPKAPMLAKLKFSTNMKLMLLGAGLLIVSIASFRGLMLWGDYRDAARNKAEQEARAREEYNSPWAVAQRARDEESKARKDKSTALVNNLLTEWSKGRSGEPYCPRTIDKLISPTEWKIVDVNSFGDVNVNVASSTKGGIPIRKIWKFNIVGDKVGYIREVE